MCVAFFLTKEKHALRSHIDLDLNLGGNCFYLCDLGQITLNSSKFCFLNCNLRQILDYLSHFSRAPSDLKIIQGNCLIQSKTLNKIFCFL